MPSVTTGWVTLIIHFIDRGPKVYSKKCNARAGEWNHWFMTAIIWIQVLSLCQLPNAVCLLRPYLDAQGAKPDAVAKQSPHGWTIWIKKEAKEGDRLQKNHTSWKLHLMPSEKQWGKAFSRWHAWTVIKGSMGRWKVGWNPRDLNSELILLLMSCGTLSQFQNFYIPAFSYR